MRADKPGAEHLTYKRLTVGTRVLGRIHTILPLHLVISLPNNLLAHIPITEISSTLTALLSAEEAAMSVSDDEGDEEDVEKSGSAPELSQLFSVGQYFPARVVATYPSANQAFMSQYPVSETTRLAARVEMSLIPEKVNGEITKADLEKGYVLVGEVKEEEDKGWRVALGLGEEVGGSNVGGWIGKEQVTKNVPCKLSKALDSRSRRIS
jgi:rRNA biogenesis protein RRP5